MVKLKDSMACFSLWQPVGLLLTVVLVLPAKTSEDHPNLFVRKETFLGLVIPDCLDWQCEGRCDSVSTLTSNTRYGCQCDNKCVLHGDCCYDFFFNCRGLPNDEIVAIIHKSRQLAYESVKFKMIPDKQGTTSVDEYQRCVREITDPYGKKDTGLYLISVCPKKWSDNETREVCENSSDNPLNMIPVTDPNRPEHTYRNLHCALCHGLSYDSVEFWKTDLNCEKEYDVSDLLKLEMIAELLSSGSCTITKSAPTDISIMNIRTCDSRSSIASTGCEQDLDEIPLDSPEHWYTMIVINPNGTMYHNPHQAQSCPEHSGPLHCVEYEHDSDDHIPISTALKAELVVHESNHVIQPVIKTAKGIHPIYHSNCGLDKVFDYFKGHCVLVKCPSGWYGHKGDCLPYEVSQYPTNNMTPLGDTNIIAVHLYFISTVDNIHCENVWIEETVVGVMKLLIVGSSRLIEKSCSKSSKRIKGETSLFYQVFGTRRNETFTDDRLSKSELEERKLKDVWTNNITKVKRQIVGDTMADSQPIVSSKDISSWNKDTTTIAAAPDSTISPDLIEKLTNMFGMPQYIHIELAITNFDLMQLSNIMSLLEIEIKETQKSLLGGRIHLESLELSNFNSTPICEYSPEIKQNLQMYQHQGVLHVFDSEEQKQLPLNNVPFVVSLGLDAKKELKTSTSVLLCRLPTTKAPLFDCPFTYQYYDEHDFTLKNNSLYIHSKRKTFEKGTFQLRGTFAYVCTVANVTKNETSSATMYRGFFTMPYTQYIVVMVCCCLSLACLLATFVTYICFAQLRDISGIILMCLTASLFVAQLLFAGGIDQIEFKPVCVTIAISLHFLWMSVFTWMNVLTYDIAHKLRLSSDETADKDSKAFKEYCIFAWGVPFLLVGICAALDFARGSGFEMMYAEDSCWIGNVYASMFGFALPVVLLLLANLTLFSCTIYALQAVARVAQLSEKQKTSRRLLVIYSALTFIMGLTWGSAYIAALLDLQEMWHAFGALNALQGLFIVCCFVLKTRVVQLYKTRFSKERKTEYSPEEFL